MQYEKLSVRALKCMYTAAILGGIAVLIIIGLINWFWLIPGNLETGSLISAAVAVLTVLNMAVSPYFRYHRYRYCINEECIDIREGYLFVEKNMALHG